MNNTRLKEIYENVDKKSNKDLAKILLGLKNDFDALDEQTKSELINAASEKLKNAGSDYIMKNMNELFSVIEDINNKLKS